jgi:predicted house-cleaning noncanonical NTP pyrophosphatase (MazG superfamily)
MSTIELKERLIEKIQTTSDSGILEEMYRLLEIEQNDATIFYFNDEQKKQIDTAKKQVQDGQYLNNLEADKEIEEWLEK